MTFFHRFISSVLRHPYRTLAVTLIFLAVSLALFPQIRIDDSLDVFFDKHSRHFIDFEAWKEQFGSDELVIVGLATDEVFTVDNLNLIKTLTEQFESLEAVEDVTSLSTVNHAVGMGEDFIVERLMEGLPQTPQEMASLRQEALGNPLYVQNVISKDGKVAALILELEYGLEGGAHKKKVMEGVQKILKAAAPSDVRYYVSGLTAIEYYYTKYMQEDLKSFGPFMFLMVAFIVYLTFRKWRLVILPLSAILASLVMTMSLLVLFKFSINNVTTIIPPILLAIMVADSIHVIGEGVARKRAIRDGSENDSVFFEETIRHLLFPCFLTSITTAVGFWSLTMSRIPPVKELGLVVGIGVAFAYLLTFTFMPALAVATRAFKGVGPESGEKKIKGFDRLFDRFLEGLAIFNERFARWIIVGSVVLVAVSVWGISRLRAETSIIEAFQKKSDIYRSTEFLEDHLSGVHPLNISLKAKSPDAFLHPEMLKRIEALSAFLYSIEEVDKVSSVNDYLKDINQSFHNEDPVFYALPDTKEMAAQYVLLYGREDLEDFVDEQWQWATVRVRLKEHSSVKLEHVIKKIDEYVQENFADLEERNTLGQTVLEVDTNNSVTLGQVQSLGMAMAVIFGMMFLVFRSVPVGVVSMVPNILPILLNFGIMGIFNIRLDSATSMIAAIGIGIVVDDTIHFLHGFGEFLSGHGDYTRAMHETLKTRGRPIIFTSVVLFFGFGVVGFSKFMLTAYFGILTALLMFTALLADLMLTPSLLIVFKPPFWKGGDKEND